MMKEFSYEANDQNGLEEMGGVIATDVADARLQLVRMGYSGINIVSDGQTPVDVAPKAAPDASRQMALTSFLPVWQQVLRAYWRCRYWWLPGVAAMALCLALGYPLYLPAALLLIGVVVSSTVAVPIVLYDQLLGAELRGNWKLGHALLKALTTMNSLGGQYDMELDWHRAKLLAGAGHLDDALEEFGAHAYVNKGAYLGLLPSVYRYGGDIDRMIETQRSALHANERNVNRRIDLAWSLVRYTRDYDEARALMTRVDEAGLTEMAQLAVRTVQAQLAQVDGQHDQALVIMRSVDDELAAYTNRLVKAMRIELHAYMALSLKALGQQGEADQLWQEAIGTLLHLHQHLLIERYEAA